MQASDRSNRLQLTAVGDGGLEAGGDLAGGGTDGLEGLDDLHGLGVSDLAEDDVLAIEPAGDDGGDEELGAVAVILLVFVQSPKSRASCCDCGEAELGSRETYVLGPALAMDNKPGLLWVSLKFSSGNFSP